MTKGERMKEIAKASPDFGKRVGYKMCVVDEFHDMKELLEENAELEYKLKNLSSVAEVRLANWQKYEKELKEAKEIIRMIIDWQLRCGNGHPTWQEVVSKANQFISEVEND